MITRTLCMLGWAATVLLGQDSYKFTQFDLADGKELFLMSCTGCHGPDGDAVAGVDLIRNKFRRAALDDELIQVIRGGIKNTGMPPSDFSKWEATLIVAYLRSTASTAGAVPVPGSVDQGRVFFEGNGNCLSCHRIRDKGSRIGPDLSNIGSHRRVAELKQSILDPDAEILPVNRFVRLVTHRGVSFTGRLLNQDQFSVQLMDSKEQLLSFSKSDLSQFAFVEKSPMPSYRGKVSNQQLTDLVSYLVSQKGREKE